VGDARASRPAPAGTAGRRRPVFQLSAEAYLSNPIQPVRGMNDVLPAEIAAWQHLERVARGIFEAYGYEEVRVPIVEHTELFKRSIGEFTDIVEKEMYTFEDLGGDSLTLRPEATAGIARAAISNGLLRGQRHKLWCSGAMFRHERPQKGRYRQFYQLDVEALGFPGPDVDAELIALSARLWRELGISRVRLTLNSLGTPASRALYRERLVEYFRAHESALDQDSRRRLDGNPLRILDSKNPELRALIDGAPVLTDHLDDESRQHFAELCGALEAMDIDYQVNPRLVRGLDYYSRTVFEWITDALGSQDAVCSGGRYDGLIAQLGGEQTPAIGFAAGIERIVALLAQSGSVPAAKSPDVYLVASGARAEREALRLAEQLRSALPGRGVLVNLGGGNFKTQFRRADRSGARLALILGDEELDRGVAAVKPLRGEGGQSDCPLAQLPAHIESLL
jgi:histidyl-tRNA synthetase